MSATSTTPKNGANLPIVSAKPGLLALTHIPTATGNRTTLPVVTHSAHLEIAMSLRPASARTNTGVTPVASIVEMEVSTTDSATSAPAMRDTRLDAVPPGEQPTRTSPRKAAGYWGRRVKVPMRKAVRGIMRY